MGCRGSALRPVTEVTISAATQKCLGKTDAMFSLGIPSVPEEDRWAF